MHMYVHGTAYVCACMNLCTFNTNFQLNYVGSATMVTSLTFGLTLIVIICKLLSNYTHINACNYYLKPNSFDGLLNLVE